MKHQAVVFAFAALMLASAAAQEVDTPAVVEKTGRHYTVQCHGGSEALAEAALAAVERAWPLATKALGVPDAPPPKPLVVHLYRTIADYEAAEQRLTAGRYRRNLAMSHHESKSSHVALQPPCTEEALRAIGIPGLTVELLAWEAAHLARFHVCPEFEQHPMWLVDGLASYVAAQVLEAACPSGDPERAPVVATRMALARDLQREKKLPAARDVLADAVDDLDFNDRYAVRAVLFRLLRSEAYAARCSKMIAAARKPASSTAGQTRRRTAVRDAAGANVDRDFAAFVQSAEPTWREVIRSLTTHGAEWHQLAFPGTNAIAWNQTPLPGGRLTARGTLRILPGGRQQLNFLFARTENGGFYSIAFVAEAGFTVFRYQSEQDTWIEVGAGNAPALRLGHGIAFGIECEQKNLRVRLADLSWDFELPEPLPREVFWGLGAQAGAGGSATGSAGFWSGVEVGDASPVKRG